MSNEFLEMEIQTEQTEQAETENPDAMEQRAEPYWEKYMKAAGQGDTATARYYLGKYLEVYQSGIEEKESDTVEGTEFHFGNKETEEEKETREKVEAERSRLKRKLWDAEQKLKNSQKALNTLLHNQMDGMKGVKMNIADREYEIKVYTKDIANLKRELSNLKT